MLWMTLDAVTTSTPEVAPEVTPEVGVLSVLTGETTRLQFKEALEIKDDEHFRKAYLLPALLERIRRLSHYAVVWQNGKPVMVGENAPEVDKKHP
ncbi:hypothetical protein [Desulfuromonas versatilis]|nr:hypothetical protein [Desulfuromonas versatilis]